MQVTRQVSSQYKADMSSGQYSQPFIMRSAFPQQSNMLPNSSMSMSLPKSSRTYSVPRQTVQNQQHLPTSELSLANVTSPAASMKNFSRYKNNLLDSDRSFRQNKIDHSSQANSSPVVNFEKHHSKPTPKKNRMACTGGVVGNRSKRHDSLPPEEDITYQSLNLTQFPSSLPHRGARRRAVVVGVTYVLTPDLILRGASNDAAAMALALVNLADFYPEDIILLIDSFPSVCYKQDSQNEGTRAGDFVPWKNRQPTRQNILLALNWLRSDTKPGDVLLFYFAGHGIQVDDLSGWEGEGYDEAVLPIDFYGDEINAITAVMIRNILLNVENDVQVTMIVDCNGGQTMLDPSGTGKWNFIKGVKQRGVWPFVTDVTDKVARAVYDQTPWTDPVMKRRGARPRFIPGAEVSSTQELLDPTLQKPSAQIASKVKGYLFAAAPWSQSAIEAKMSAIRLTPIDRSGSIIRQERKEKHYAYHGVFTWCFITALQELLIQSVMKTKTKMVSYKRLLSEVERRITAFKTPQGGLPKLDQFPELTFYRSGGSDGRDFFLWPFGGRRKGVNFVNDSHYNDIQLPCFPNEHQYLSIWDAEEQLRQAGENRRRNDPAFVLKGMASLYSTSAYRDHNLSGQFARSSIPQPMSALPVSQPRSSIADYNSNMNKMLMNSNPPMLSGRYTHLNSSKPAYNSSIVQNSSLISEDKASMSQAYVQRSDSDISQYNCVTSLNSGIYYQTPQSCLNNSIEQKRSLDQKDVVFHRDSMTTTTVSDYPQYQMQSNNNEVNKYSRSELKQQHLSYISGSALPSNIINTKSNNIAVNTYQTQKRHINSKLSSLDNYNKLSSYNTNISSNQNPENMYLSCQTTASTDQFLSSNGYHTKHNNLQRYT